MNDSTVRVVRNVISMGDIPLDVFQLPDASYKLSQTQLAEAVDKKRQSVSDFLGSKSPEALPFKEFTCQKGKVEGEKTTVNLVPVEIASAYWVKEALAGNAKAIRILGACVAESIERRADKAFAIERKEEDYQKKMKIRIDGKIVRKSLVMAISDYIKRHPELSENNKKWLFKNCTDKTNIVVLGKIAKKAAEELGCDRSQLRDFLEAEQLVCLTSMEDLIVRLVDRNDVHPFEAVIQAAERLLLSSEN